MRVEELDDLDLCHDRSDRRNVALLKRGFSGLCDLLSGFDLFVLVGFSCEQEDGNHREDGYYDQRQCFHFSVSLLMLRMPTMIKVKAGNDS